MKEARANARAFFVLSDNLVGSTAIAYFDAMNDLADFGYKVTYEVPLPGGQARLREAALYVMRRSENSDFFGLVKLNKILWRADFQSYRERFSPVTGRQYQRLQNGPAPVEMKPILNELIARGDIVLRSTSVPGEQRPVAIAQPNLQHFSAYDLRYLDEAIEYYREKTAREASDLSHGLAWLTRQDGDPIPYEAAYFDDRPMPNNLRLKLSQIARERGWRTT
ncbi:MAG TPA: Panacea domain-containing protein [Devosiaceae bacterium]|jgi:hypothetical protein|nr:Panacea domain-containing protein [Devosiaceae bacterium]